MSVSVLLLDYGEVICRAQPPEIVAAMAALCELDGATFAERYWQHRPGYDRGGSPQSFWSAVCGTPVGDATLAELRRLDTESWMDIDPAALELLDDARARGLRLALLSNAPRDLADRLGHESALRHVSPLLFSSHLELVKPEPEIFAAALAALRVPGNEILFVDDRAANVEAAAAAGLRSLRFSSVAELRDALARLD